MFSGHLLRLPTRMSKKHIFTRCTDASGHSLRLPLELPKSLYLQGVLMFLATAQTPRSNSHNTLFIRRTDVHGYAFSPTGDPIEFPQSLYLRRTDMFDHLL